MSDRIPDEQKFRELILFISVRSEGDPAFGATKLNKLLFFADFLAYLKWGKAITWQPYQKLEWGPAPRALLPVLEKMKQEGDIAESKRSYFGKTQRRTVALRDANLERFTADEIALVTELIEHLWGKNATDVSGLSHDFLGWQAAELQEVIPYEVALIRVPEFTPAIAKQCKELEAAAQECLSRSHG